VPGPVVDTGIVLSASRGVFSISAADCVLTGNDAGGVDSGGASMMKNVCVVATVDYYLVR
jgi:uncharacterized protein